MHNIEELCELKEKLIKELIDQGKKDGTLNNIDTLAHAIKNICKIIEDCEMDEEYSGRRYSRAQGGGSGAYANAPYSYMPAYSMASMGMMPEYAWAQNGNSGARRSRDSMGRYSSHGNLTSELYSIMNSAQNEMDRQEIQNLINRLEQR